MSTPVVATPPSRQVSRALVAGQDLHDELDRWSAYAQAAQAEGRLQTRAATEMVTVATREAARAVNLGQRHDNEIAEVSTQLDSVARLTARAEQRLRQRHDSWRHSERIVQEAIRSWTMVGNHEREGLTLATLKHAKAERLVQKLGARKAAEDTDKHPRRRRARTGRRSPTGDTPTLAQLLAQARVAETAAGRDMAEASARLERSLTALSMTERAYDLVERSMRDLVDGMRSAQLASDLVRDARQQLERATSLAEQQHDATDALMNQSRQAVRAVESSGPALGAIDDRYDDAQRHLFEARRQISDRLDALRVATFSWSPPVASGRCHGQR